MRSAFPNQHPPSQTETTLALRLGAVGLVATIALALFVVLPGGVLAERPQDTTTTAALEGALPPLYVPSPGGLTIGVADISDVDDLTAQLGFKIESLASFDTQGQRFVTYIPGAPQRINAVARERMRGRLVIFVRRQALDTSGYAPGTVLRLSSQGTSASSAGTTGVAGAPPAATPSSTPSATPAPTPLAPAVKTAAGATPAPTVTATPVVTATPAPSATVAPTSTATATASPTVAPTTVPTAVPKAAASPARTTPQGCQAVPDDRLALLNERTGFGANATGGANGCLYVVTSDADSGPGSLRAGAETGNRWIIFERGMTVKLNGAINVAANTTIDGRGAQVTLTRGLYVLKNQSNVIITNLTLRQPDLGGGHEWDDLLRVEDATDWWFDHLTVGGKVDEYLDIARPNNGPTIHGTVSWTRFEPYPGNEDRTILIGWDGGYVNSNAPIYVTLHHNYYDGTYQRHPLVTNAKVHSFNNVVTWQLWGLHVRRLGGAPTELVSENDVFDAGSVLWDGKEFGLKIEDSGNRVRVKDPLLLNGAGVKEENAGQAFVPPYPYSLDPASVADGAVRGGAGAR